MIGPPVSGQPLELVAQVEKFQEPVEPRRVRDVDVIVAAFRHDAALLEPIQHPLDLGAGQAQALGEIAAAHVQVKVAVAPMAVFGGDALERVGDAAVRIAIEQQRDLFCLLYTSDAADE